MRTISLDEFIALHAQMPAAVLQVMEQSEPEKVLTRNVQTRYQFTEEQSKQFFRTYLGLFFRIVSLHEFIQFFSGMIAQQGFRLEFVKSVLFALYEYGNAVPDVKKTLEMYRIPFPEHAPMLQNAPQILLRSVQDTDANTASYPKVSISKIIEKYPKVLYQMITSNDIFIRGSADLVKPTLKNWITVYHQELGAGMHDVMERTNFLHQQKNTAVLSQEERDHLSIIFQSLDEGLPIFFDDKNQKIVFSDVSAIEKPLQPAKLYYDENGTITGNLRNAPLRYEKNSPSSDTASRSGRGYLSQSVFVPASRPVTIQKPGSVSGKLEKSGFIAPNFLGGGADDSQERMPRGNMFGNVGIAQPPKMRNEDNQQNSRYSANSVQPQSSSQLRFSSPQRLPGEQAGSNEKN